MPLGRTHTLQFLAQYSSLFYVISVTQAFSPPDSWSYLNLQSHLSLWLVVWLSVQKQHILPSAQILAPVACHKSLNKLLRPFSVQVNLSFPSYLPWPSCTYFALPPSKCALFPTPGPLPALHPSIGVPLLPVSLFNSWTVLQVSVLLPPVHVFPEVPKSSD